MPIWLPYSKMVPPSRTYQQKSSATYFSLHLIIYPIHYKMSGMSQVVQPSCSLLLSNEPTTALSSKAICNLNDTEWDKLTRSDMAGKLLDYLDKLYDKNDGRYYLIFKIIILNFLELTKRKVYITIYYSNGVEEAPT